MTDGYEDIINLPHYVSKTRQRMPMEDRAAQFSAFAALKGYDVAIKETGRITSEKIVMDESKLYILDMKLKQISEHIGEEPEVSILYFEQDIYKTGGSYERYKGIIRKIDEYERCIIMKDGKKLLFDNIFDIEY